MDARQMVVASTPGPVAEVSYDDGSLLVITITDEGLVIDTFGPDGDCNGSTGQTFDELYDEIADTDDGYEPVAVDGVTVVSFRHVDGSPE